MFLPWRKYSGFAALFVLLAACNHIDPVYNVEADAVPQGAQQPLTAEQVGNVITKVARGQGWNVEKRAPGFLHCTLTWNDHSATAGVDTALSCLHNCAADKVTSAADITYSEQSYSIHLDPSQNVDQSDRVTYRRYNRYIQQLQKEIDKDLSLIAFN